MKVYLLNAPYMDNFVRCGRWQGVAARGGTLYYPLWLAYTTGLLEKEGHQVKLVDAIASKWQLDDVIKDVIAFSPDIIVIDSNFSSMKNDCMIANALKEKTDAITILTGTPTKVYADDILNLGLDIVTRMEYDYTVLDIVNTLEKGDDLANVNGISYQHEGIKVHNPERKPTIDQDLDNLPYVSKVYQKYLNIEDYFLNHAYHPMVQIFTTRGCPNQCTFCSWPENLMGRTYRTRSIDSILGEFAYIINELPMVKEIFIEDDSFTINKQRVLDFCAEIKKRDLKVRWGCQSRATLDYETMVAMKSAGCRLLDVGYESGNLEILKNIRKGTTPEILREFTKNARKAGLKILADFVIGFPGETKETAEETIKFIKEIKPDILQIAVATPMPGTQFYNYVKENNYLLVDDLSESLDENGFQKCIVSYPWLSNVEIQQYVDRALKEYYLSLSYLGVALGNVLSKNMFHEIKMLWTSAWGYFKYSNR